jgi:hypothetical protein
MRITLEQLNRAHYHVMGELESLGLFSSPMNDVEVFLVPFSWDCYGWQNYGSDGSICIPSISVARLSDLMFNRPTCTLRDVLRHEWAHALAHHHNDLVSRKTFERAFDGGHENEEPARDHCPIRHISEYAQTNPSEDFAENFMHYIRCRGVLPRKWQSPAIMKRWRFIEGLAGRVGSQ